MARRSTYSDEQLVSAIARSSSWRGALRELGLAATSSGSIRSVRSHADRLGIDYRHFTSRSRWNADQLRGTIGRASTWDEVAGTLGARSARDIATLKGHAVRLRLDTLHLDQGIRERNSAWLKPDKRNLGRAGSLMAAAWFTLCGCDVSWPLEASRFDLIVAVGGSISRVQVKTTVTRVDGSWKVFLSTSGAQRQTYGLDEIDYFFVIDGDFDYYLIPIASVAGLHAIHLSAYREYLLTPLGEELTPVPGSGPPRAR